MSKREREDVNQESSLLPSSLGGVAAQPPSKRSAAARPPDSMQRIPTVDESIRESYMRMDRLNEDMRALNGDLRAKDVEMKDLKPSDARFEELQKDKEALRKDKDVLREQLVLLGQQLARLEEEAKRREAAAADKAQGSSSSSSSPSNEGSIALPPAQDGSDKILDQVLAIARRSNSFPLDDLKLIDPTPVQPPGINVRLPATVNTDVLRWADLRLPHDDHPLLGTEGPLFDMRDDVLKVIRASQFAHVVLIGSSGCGKTTTAFMVAKQHFCIYLECGMSGSGQRLQGHHLDINLMLRPPQTDTKDRYAAIKRRLDREVLARCVLLAILRKAKNITPYQWLLLSLSDNRNFDQMLAALRAAFKGNCDEHRKAIMRAVANALQDKPCLIIDEAHLLCEREGSVTIPGTEKPVDTFSATLTHVSDIPFLSSCVWIGTQVGLRESARLASAVSKKEADIPLYAFCSFPYLSADDVAARATEILGEDFATASHLLYGRARVFVSLILERLQNPQESVEDVVRLAVKGIRLVEEIKRVVDHNGFGTTDLLSLWMASICYDDARKEERFCPERVGGTLTFTLGFKNFGKQEYKTGGDVLEGGADKLSFEHVLDEPFLVPAIVEYLGAETSRDPHDMLFEHAVKSCVNFSTEPSIRGSLLDVAVLVKTVCSRGCALNTWLPLDDRFAKNVTEAVSDVKRIVSGKGMLRRWLEAVLQKPDEDFIPGFPARHVCVRPETRAGADGVFAAFYGETVVLVTMACAWYGSEGVPPQKWKDQAERSSMLSKQFLQKKKETATASKEMKKGDKGVSSAKKTKTSGSEANGQIQALLGKHRQKLAYVRVLFELPCRTGALPADNKEGADAVVVDHRNVKGVLGDDIHDAVLQQLKEKK